MIISIKDYLTTKDISGNIILYRDNQHKKKELCEYIAKNVSTNKTICCSSGGAYGLYLAKAFPNNNIVICGSPSAEYKKQIDRLSNVTIKTTIRETSPESTNIKDYAEQQGYYHISQYTDPLIEEYYKIHFADILKELEGVNIDAFCDCGHSCATLSGFIAADLVKWAFILGVVRPEGIRTWVHHLSDKTDKFVQETTRNFDTKQIQLDIEEMYPDFGNVFEATRSISAAMSWLLKNPGKTVLVYVGDSPVFGEDAII